MGIELYIHVDYCTSELSNPRATSLFQRPATQMRKGEQIIGKVDFLKKNHYTAQSFKLIKPLHCNFNTLCDQAIVS